MIEWNKEQLQSAGIDDLKLIRILTRLNRLALDLNKMGLTVYVASGHANLIHESKPTHTGNGVADRSSVVASVRCTWDGGDW
jgi:hypothetical protein